MKQMTITIFIEPKSLPIFLEVAKILSDLPLDNDYVFSPSDIVYSEQLISNWIWINMDIAEYIEFKYCCNKLKR